MGLIIEGNSESLHIRVMSVLLESGEMGMSEPGLCGRLRASHEKVRKVLDFFLEKGLIYKQDRGKHILPGYTIDKRNKIIKKLEDTRRMHIDSIAKKFYGLLDKYNKSKDKL